MDRKQSEKRCRLAEANGLTDAFNWYIENIAAAIRMNTGAFRQLPFRSDAARPYKRPDQRMLVYSTTNYRCDKRCCRSARSSAMNRSTGRNRISPISVAFHARSSSRHPAQDICVIIEDSTVTPKTSWKGSGRRFYNAYLHIGELLWELEMTPDPHQRPNLASPF